MRARYIKINGRHSDWQQLQSLCFLLPELAEFIELRPEPQQRKRVQLIGRVYLKPFPHIHSSGMWVADCPIPRNKNNAPINLQFIIDNIIPKLQEVHHGNSQ